MAKRNRPPPIKFGPLSELGRKRAAQREALQKGLIEDWIKNKPTKIRLQNALIFLVQNPELIQEPHYSVYIYHGLRSLVKKMPRGRRPSQEDIAELVDLCVSGGMSLGKARQFVADSLRPRKSVEAVKEAHLRENRRHNKSR
jgi:uncharacterized protein YoaH (UPF0181 family)